MTPPAPAAPIAPAPTAAAHSGVRRVFGNLAHLLGGKAAAGVISLIYLVLVTRQLGAEDYGVLVLVNAYAVLIGSLVAFSGFHGVVRYGALALERGDHAGFARIVRHLAVIELVCGAVAIIVAAALAPAIGPKLGWSPATVALAIPYSLAVIGTVRATPQGLLQLAGRFDLIGAHQAISSIVRLVGTLGVWFGGGGLTGFILVWLVAAVAEGVAMWLLAATVWRKLGGGQPWRGPWRRGGIGEAGMTRFILTTNFDITVRELAPNLAPVTIGWVLGPAASGLFALAQRATSLIGQPAVLLSQASFAVLAEQAARVDLRAFRHTVRRSAVVALALSVPVLVLIALFGGHLLTLLGGATFTGGVTLVLLVALGRVAGLASAPLAAGLSALGRPGRSMAVGLAANLGLYPLLPILLWAVGTDGAGWHALVQGWAAAAALAWYFSRDAADRP